MPFIPWGLCPSPSLLSLVPTVPPIGRESDGILDGFVLPRFEAFSRFWFSI